jgi:Fe-S-cluster-containing hydrogenase component 2/CRP-like cAMP-binding protein
MAKTIVMNPPAELERRARDVPVAAERYLKFSLFARLAKKPTVERFPGTLVLRRFRAGEVICRQGESGWTAFYLLTTEDVQDLSENRQRLPPGSESESAIDSAGSPRRVATVHLASARPARPGVGGWLKRLAHAVLRRPAHAAERRPLFIPIDAPTEVSYDNRQAPLYEGDLFGEQSCLYGTPRSATIVADRDCYVLEMLRNILDQIQGDKAYRAEMDAVYKTRILKDHLHNLPLFADLTDEQFARLRDSVGLFRCKDGHLIYDEHDRSDGLYVIRSGLVKVMKNVSSLLAAEDVLDWSKLTALLPDETAAPSAAAGHIRQLLPKPIREGASTEAGRADLIAALNDILKDAKFANAAPMQTLASPALTEFVGGLPAKRAEWTELDRRRHNRLLLETAFPGLFRKRQRPGGPETVLAYLGRGEIIGEMGLMARQPRAATCIAYVHPRPDESGAAAGKWRRETEHVELVRISKEAFAELIESAPSVRAKMEQLIAARKQSEREIHVRAGVDRSEGLLSGRAEELGLIQGQKLMLIDLDRCTRCDECVQACVNTHDDGRTRLFLDGPRFGKYLVPTTCRACLDPVCMIGCPVGSIHRGDNRQIVIEDWCIGCGLCATNCPYGSIQMHDVGVIAGSVHGWRYAPSSLAGAGWERRRYSAARWLAGKTPFTDDRAFEDSLSQLGKTAAGEGFLCFRYEFSMNAHLLRTAGGFKLEVTSADESATVWLNGHEVAKPAEKPKRGKREYVVTREMNLFRAGGNVLAIKVVPPPAALGKRAILLDVRLDEVRVPDVPAELRETAEISEKVVTDLAVVCDQCSSQFGRRPACVTACPHDAAMRVDARFNFPAR